MNGHKENRAHGLLKPFRIARTHGRLMSAIAFGVVLALVLPWHWHPPTRLLVAWDCAIVFYLGLVVRLMMAFDVDSVRRRAASVDEGAIFILALTAIAAFVSLGAIIAEIELARSKFGGHGPIHFSLAVVTIFLSWTFIHTIFAFHYAHEFYGEGDGAAHKGGLDFPHDPQPDYWDFVYYSFAIGMSTEVSDVRITSKRLRRFTTAHAVLSFLFNLAILALAVNIGASLI
jgi:uncharacterized membrane protein